MFFSGSHLVRIKPPGVFPALLGGIKSVVRFFQQDIIVLSVLWREGNADTSGKVDRTGSFTVFPGLDMDSGKDLAELSCTAGEPVCIESSRKDDQKFVAADPPDQIFRTHPLFDLLCDMPEHLIACSVAVGVVDLLKIVQIKEKEGERLTLREKKSGFLLNPCAIEQAGQGIGYRFRLPVAFFHMELFNIDQFSVVSGDLSVFIPGVKIAVVPAHAPVGSGKVKLHFYAGHLGCEPEDLSGMVGQNPCIQVMDHLLTGKMTF